MPYADQNDYNRYQSCDCENKDNCNCNDTCGCCPIGTIEVKDDCGNHVACLLPADASQYYIDTLNVPEGFIKVFDSEGVYIGLLTVAEYTEWLSSTGAAFSFANVGAGEGVFKDQVGATVNFKSINVTGPATVTSDADNIYINIQQGINAYNSKVPEDDATILKTVGSIAGGSSTLQFLSIDRINYFGSLNVTYANLPIGFTNTISGGNITIPSNKSIIDGATGFLTFSWTALDAGIYSFDLVISGVGITSVTLTISITLS